jgi:hypothetical protein
MAPRRGAAGAALLAAGLAACSAGPAGPGPAGRSSRVARAAAVSPACAGGQPGGSVPLGQASGTRVLPNVVIETTDGGLGLAVALSPARPWPFWQKRGLFIRGGTPPVTITVPAAWRDRAAVTWSNDGAPPVSTLRLAACAEPGDRWAAYPGGIFLTSPAGCVPLIFRSGSRAATVTFSIGRQCG